MSQKIFVLEGHPHAASFCEALSTEVKLGAEEAGNLVRHLKLSDLNFNINLLDHDPNNQSLEKDLEDVWDALEWCDHVVIIHPLWWGSAPAKLKGLFDRTLRPEHAFSYQNGNPLPSGLLKGRSAQVILTSDTPTWFYRLGYRSAWSGVLRRQILGFCGLKVGSIQNFGPLRSSKLPKREAFLKKARNIGLAFTS